MSKGLPSLVAAACLAVQLASCGGGGSPGGGGPTGGGTAHTLSGTLVYDKVRSTVNGLDYVEAVEKPIRGAEVRVVDAATSNTVLGSGVTDNSGHYSVSWNGDASVKVAFLSRTTSPRVTVVDNTAGKAVYGLISNTIDANSTSTVNLKAASGWTGTSYASRGAAPFAVLDAVWEAVLAFQAARPAVVFPDLVINWSANNAPVGRQANETQDQAYAAGRIGTSHWNGSELYILGQADVDTDEFDDHVIVHEWGHYFESKLGRSDSPGGPHSAGEFKDPRLAFGEGWGNALSAMIWSPNTVYSDSSGLNQASGFGFDLEDNLSNDPNPGWFSETSVQSILYDLFDAANEAHDGVALGLGPIYDVMTGAQKNTSALTTLFSFVAALKAANPGQAAAIDVLTQFHGVLNKPVADAYGSTETNFGDSATNLPVYRSISAGTPVSVTFAGAVPNAASQNRYLRYTGNGASHTVSISTPTGEDVDVYVLQNGIGNVRAFAEGPTGTEATGSFFTTAGVEYIILVSGFGGSASYTTTVTVN
jgi:hypothetical protein